MHISDGILPPSVAIAGYAITGGVTWYSLRQINKEKNPQENIPKASLLTAAFFVASLIHIPIPPTSIHLILNGMMGAILGYYAFPAILIGLFFQAVMFGHGGLSTLGLNAAMMGIPALFAYHIFNLRLWVGKKPLAKVEFTPPDPPLVRGGNTDSLGEFTPPDTPLVRGGNTDSLGEFTPPDTPLVRGGNTDSLPLPRGGLGWGLSDFRTGIFAFLAGAGALGLSASIFTIVVITTISADIDVKTEQMAIYTAMIAYSFQALIEGAFTVMLVDFIQRVKPELLES